MSKVLHVLGISGGKDSAALAIYLKNKYSREELPIEYYSCDTGNELKETYNLISQLEAELGQKIKIYQSSDYKNIGGRIKTPFHFFLEKYGNFLPSQNARWCTKDMKLGPFEKAIGENPTISYVGIRGDEDREGYISTKGNVQSIFPFRKNIWSKDVINKFFSENTIEGILDFYKLDLSYDQLGIVSDILKRPLDLTYRQNDKLNDLLNHSIKGFNHAIVEYLKTTSYPVGQLEYFPLVDNEEVLVRQDIFDILKHSGVELPEYYKPIEYQVDGETGMYFRSRSGCYFCFYQQKIEWVWLLEQHEDLFYKAAEFEKEGYNWIQGESLLNLAKPERVQQIKRDHLNRMKKKYRALQAKKNWQDTLLGEASKDYTKDNAWLSQVINAEGEGCASCFI